MECKEVCGYKEDTNASEEDVSHSLEVCVFGGGGGGVTEHVCLCDRWEARVQLALHPGIRWWGLRDSLKTGLPAPTADRRGGLTEHSCHPL